MVYSILVYDENNYFDNVQNRFKTNGTKFYAIVKAVKKMELYKLPNASINYNAFGKCCQILIERSKENKNFYKWDIWRIENDGIFYIIEQGSGYGYDLIEYYKNA